MLQGAVSQVARCTPQKATQHRAARLRASRRISSACPEARLADALLWSEEAYIACVRQQCTQPVRQACQPDSARVFSLLTHFISHALADVIPHRLIKPAQRLRPGSRSSSVKVLVAHDDGGGNSGRKARLIV